MAKTSGAGEKADRFTIKRDLEPLKELSAADPAAVAAAHLSR